MITHFPLYLEHSTGKVVIDKSSLFDRTSNFDIKHFTFLGTVTGNDYKDPSEEMNNEKK